MPVNMNINGQYKVNGVPIGGGSNPSVITLIAENSPSVTGTTLNTIVQSLFIPANTFTPEGMIEILVRYQKTGAAGQMSCRLYTNTSLTLSGSTLIAGYVNASSTRIFQAIRTGRVNSNVLSVWPSAANTVTDYANAAASPTTATFDTSIDNYLLFAVSLANISDSVLIPMAQAVIYS